MAIDGFVLCSMCHSNLKKKKKSVKKITNQNERQRRSHVQLFTWEMVVSVNANQNERQRHSHVQLFTWEMVVSVNANQNKRQRTHWKRKNLGLWVLVTGDRRRKKEDAKEEEQGKNRWERWRKGLCFSSHCTWI